MPHAYLAGGKFCCYLTYCRQLNINKNAMKYLKIAANYYQDSSGKLWQNHDTDVLTRIYADPLKSCKVKISRHRKPYKKALILEKP